MCVDTNFQSLNPTPCLNKNNTIRKTATILIRTHQY